MKSTVFHLNHGIWRHSQVVRHGSATPLSPVRIWLSPLENLHRHCVCGGFLCAARGEEISCFAATLVREEFAFNIHERIEIMKKEKALEKR